MPAVLRSIEIAVPPVSLRQEELRNVFAEQPGISALAKRLIRAAFDHSGIERRHTAVAELGLAAASDGGTSGAAAPGGGASAAAAAGAEAAGGPAPGPAGDPAPDAVEPLFFDVRTREVLAPSTGARNAFYAREAPGLFVGAARRAVEACPGLEPGAVTHLVTASCTGFYAPGPDLDVVRGLGLPASVKRSHLGFMGCCAAFPALRQAAEICGADPSAVVLVVCAELCSIHLRTAEDPDTIRGASLFADGAAAAVVTGPDAVLASGAVPAPGTAQAPAGEAPAPVLHLDRFETTVTPTGGEEMAWSIGDLGFEMVLGSYVPQIIGTHIEEATAPLVGEDRTAVRHWAIHPGGRSILDKVEETLGLSPEQLEPSRAVLRDYGNMSSATVLFVLREILRAPMDADEELVCGMAFGPGLTVETALMRKTR
ncbi:type III polyketide synthase [Rothia halotolerans]|uniref:type III polyketide synthase n=1 Tax=Rothia halotolerans TaxID=405770 RepID=UPI00101C8225|nr:type III polyketide synthase [Rothia halotolerans]